MEGAMNKFEQLIEYVINNEEAKARELFHDIVVEKSRAIYEEMMQEEELDEAESTEKEDERAERAGRKVAKDIEYDDKKDRAMKESADEDIDEGMMGGDQADDLIDDVETEEQGMSEEDDDNMDMDMDGDDHHADVGGEEELEDRVVDLEDKLDELMAEFEALMGDNGDTGGEEVDMDIDGDMDMDMDAEEVVDDEFETEGVMEATNLKPVPKPTHGDNGANNKSPVAANAGAKGPVGNTVKPVKTGSDMGGRHDTAAYKNTVKDEIGRVGNTPGQSTQEPKPAPKPKLGQESGVNTKSILKQV
jgi:hypothetical protein